MQKTRKARRKQKAGIRSTLSNNAAANLRAVLAYERFPDRNRKVPRNTQTIRERITALLLKQAPLAREKVVWRGQSTCSINPVSWFSTSYRNEIARSYGGRCLFKIHLQPGVRILDMYKYYGTVNITNPYNEPNAIRTFMGIADLNVSNNYVDYGEVIVQAGGRFWKDAAHTKPGFQRIGSARPTEVFGSHSNIDDPDWPDMDVYECYYSVN